ncbi:MAG: tetratricopeptide repeat protein [Calditrichia bacterium]|nr:tetratricopeptide repeat protein [Calditrichia bacterium]
MKRILIAVLCLVIFSSCAWFTGKPIKELEKPKSETEELMAREIEAEAENYVSNGITFHQDGKDSLAVIEWKRALELIPGDAEIHNFLGISYHRLNKLDDAITHFRIATEFDSKYFQALNNLGYLLFIQEKYSQAKKFFNKSLENNPEYQPAKLNLQNVNDIVNGKLSRNVFELSQSAEKIKDLDEKIAKYKEIISLDSTYAEGHNNIGVAYYYKFVEGNGDENDSSYYDFLDSAYIHLNFAIELRKNYPESMNNLGYIYKVAARYEDAIKLFLKAVSTKKEYIIALNNLGETYQLNKEFENARRVFKTVLDLDSSNEFARDSFELLIERENE